MLTDYHLHLRPDEDGHRRRALLHAENVERYLAPPRPPGSRSSASPSTSTASARRSTSGATRSGSSRRATTSTPTASSSAALRCGSGSSATSSPAPRSAPRRCSRRATSTTSSARSTSSASDAVDHEGWDVWEASGDPDEVWRRYFEALAECARSGLFDILAHPDLVKVWGGARPLPERDPRAYYEPAVEAIAESGIAVEVSTAGLRKPVGELYPAARLRRDVRRGRAPPSRSPPTPTCPSRSATATTRPSSSSTGSGWARSASSSSRQPQPGAAAQLCRRSNKKTNRAEVYAQQNQ